MLSILNSGASKNPDFKSNSVASTDEGSSYKKPRSIVDALSEIQRYNIIESKSDELPSDYFTIQQVFDFFKIGVKSGFLEMLIFIILLPFLQTIYPSFKLFFLGDEITNKEQFFFTISSFLPFIASTLFMVYLSKYYEGTLSKRGIFSLISGRSLIFLVKGVGFYYLLHYILNISLKSPNIIYTCIDFFTAYKAQTNKIYSYYYKFIMPALDYTANEVLFSVIIFALLPYLTVFYRGYVKKLEKYNMKREYENY